MYITRNVHTPWRSKFAFICGVMLSAGNFRITGKGFRVKTGVRIKTVIRVRHASSLIHKKALLSQTVLHNLH